MISLVIPLHWMQLYMLRKMILKKIIYATPLDIIQLIKILLANIQLMIIPINIFQKLLNNYLFSELGSALYFIYIFYIFLIFLFVKKRLDTKKSNRFSHYFFIFSGIGRNIQNDSPLSIQFDTLLIPFLIPFDFSVKTKKPEKLINKAFLTLSGAGDERIELPPKVLETPIIPLDQSPIFYFVVHHR